MTEQELQNFIENNNECIDLEYKLKPNFNEIKKALTHLSKRMHFNILKTIYAFANTEGGTLFIGIKEDNGTKKPIKVGVDNCDEKLIDSILKQVSKKINLKKKKPIKIKSQKRVVIKIVVYKLKLYDNPQLLDGILYLRDDNSTKSATADDWRKICIEKQFYLYDLNIVRDNLHKIKKQDSFIAGQFITGLIQHIKKFAKENKIPDDNETIKKSKELLNTIQKGITAREITNLKFATGKLAGPEQDINKAIDDFIKTYEIIIKMGA